MDHGQLHDHEAGEQRFRQGYEPLGRGRGGRRRAHGCALVASDGAGRWPLSKELTAPFAYVWLHGSSELYTIRYTDDELDEWAALARGWLKKRRDVYVYFDNDARVHAPHDARRLIQRLGSQTAR